jgi:hypothetical protein
MIRYDLRCEKGHEFDAWFSDSASFDRQCKRGFVECAVCGSNKVEKQLMRPNIGTRSNRKGAASHPMMAGATDARTQKMIAMMREFRAHVEMHAENVGDRFAEEARNIHYRESEERGIYGKATPEETKGLIEEGIEVHPLPRLPEDNN